MKKLAIFLLALNTAGYTYAQKTVKKTTAPETPLTAADTKMLAIPAEQANKTKDVADYIKANFATPEERIRAIFVWTTATFAYDYDNMFSLNFHETEAEKVTRMMALRKGICQDYAAVFVELCKQCDIKAWEISGYTRHERFTSYLPHAWCGAVIGGRYYIFDPTWGSGYIDQNNKFVRHVDFHYFQQDPAAMIKTHMPFDPMWEFLNYPVNAQEFTDGKTEVNTTKPLFSYADSIAAYEKLNELQQYETAARRLEANGFKNSLAYNQLAFLKQNISVKKESFLVDTYNGAVSDFNLAVSDLNEFINYRNKQFTPAKSDPEIQGMMDSVMRKLDRMDQKLAAIRGQEKRIDDMATSMQRQIDEVRKTANEQQDFLAKYFPKGKLGRKTSFYKYTWMGIPLN